MEEMNHGLLMEALSDKVLHQLPPAVWKQLFLGAATSIHFEQRHLTLLHADAVIQFDAGNEWERFAEKLQPLAAHYHGRLDPYGNATALVSFEDPAAAVRMAMALQRVAANLGLQVGVVSGRCTLAFFRVQGRLWCTPLGPELERAAQVAATAPLGGIVISPETYAPGDLIRAPHGSGNDFQHSEVDLSTLAFAAAEVDAEPELAA